MKLPSYEVDYLKLVEDWVDPNPTPIIEKMEGIYVVRDDLLPAGSKMRFIDPLIRNNTHVQEWVYGHSPLWGFGQVSLAAVCQRYGKKSTLFLAKSKEYHINTQKAISYGAQVHQVVGGLMAICNAAAKKYVANTPGAFLVPFGLESDMVYGAIIKVALGMGFVPDIVVTVAGSGVMSRGLQKAWPDAEFYMVQVGHKITPSEQGRAKLIVYPLPFKAHCPKEERPPFPSVPEYDAKAWKTALQVRDENLHKKILFWNVAG